MRRPEKRSLTLRSTTKILGRTAVPLGLLILWEISARALNEPWIFPSVMRVFSVLLHPMKEYYVSGTLAGNTVVSLVRVLIGFSFALLAGVPLGLLMGSLPSFRRLTEPTLEILRPLCPIAWLPFAIAVFKMTTFPQLFGIRFTHTLLDQVQLSTVFVLFWGAFFPILVNTLDGVAGIRKNYIILARTLGATRTQLFLRVRLPAAMPMILTGLRQGIGICWFVIIAAEMLPGSDSGIGYLLLYAADLADMHVVVAAMIIIGGIGAALSLVMRLAMAGLVHWQGKEI